MGQVFLCQDTVRQGKYAIKIIHPHLAPIEEVRRRFFQELKVTERLTHPGIVRTYNFEHQPLLFFIMEYVEGLTLDEVLREAKEQGRKPPISIFQCLRLLKELCGILTYAHSQGVIHRDIKPPNVMLTRDGHVKLMDFGIAKLLDESLHVRHTGFQGTVYYMAPEQLQGGGLVTPAADVFSLGILAYQLLTGEMPVGAVSPPSFYSSALTSTVDAVILQAMAQEPQHRYPTPHSFWTALAHVLEPVLTMSTTSSLLHHNSSAQLPIPIVSSIETQELLRPLDPMPVHPTLEGTLSVSALQQEPIRNEYRTDIEIPTARPSEVLRAFGQKVALRDSGEVEPTQSEIPSTVQTSFTRSSSGGEDKTRQQEEYPMIRQNALPSRGSEQDLYHNRFVGEDITNTEVPKAALVLQEQERESASAPGFAFPSLDGLREVQGQFSSDKETAQHPIVGQRGVDETAVEIASLQTYRSSGSLHSNRATLSSSSSSARKDWLTSSPHPLHHTLDPSFFTSFGEDEMIALEERSRGLFSPLPPVAASSETTPEQPTVLQSDDDLLPWHDDTSQGHAQEKKNVVPSVHYTAISLPPVPFLLESKFLYSRRDEPLLEFVKIPAGSFFMGSFPEDPLHCDNELPQRHVHLDSYWIARTPITNRIWKVFLEESGYTCRDEDYLLHWKQQEPPSELLEHPVVYVSIDDVKQFCAFYGLHIPSEAQWERAVRGDHGFLWPWGDSSPEPDLSNFLDAGWGTTTPVGMFPRGMSPYGLFDCAGNVWEWCADEWLKDWLDKMGERPRNPLYQLATPGKTRRRVADVHHSIRGGCFLYRSGGVRCAFRYKSAKRAMCIGARVAMVER